MTTTRPPMTTREPAGEALLAEVENERQTLLGRHISLSERIAEIAAELTRTLSHMQYKQLTRERLELGAESQRIQGRLSALKAKRAKLARSVHTAAPKERGPDESRALITALFDVAHTADDYLYDDQPDEQYAGDRLENALKRLEHIRPGWRRP